MDASNSNRTPESMSADEAKCSKAEEKPDYISEHPVSSFQLHRETSQNQILATLEEESLRSTICVEEELAFKPTAECDFCDVGNCSENLPSTSTATSQTCIVRKWKYMSIEKSETTEIKTVSLFAKSALEEDFVAKETGSNVCEYKVYDKQEIRVTNTARKSVKQYSGIKAPKKNERSDAENNSTFKKSVDKTKEHTLSNFYSCRTNLPSLLEEAFYSRKTIVNKSKNISKTKQKFTESTKTDKIGVSKKLIQSGRKIGESEIRTKNTARKSLIKHTSVKSTKKNEGDMGGYSSIFEKTANGNKERDLSNRYKCSANLQSSARKCSSNDMSIDKRIVTKIKKAVAIKKSNPSGERVSEISQINKYQKKFGLKTARKTLIGYNWNPTGKIEFETLLPVQHEGSISVQENVLENTMPITARKFPKCSYWIPPGESALKTLLLSTNQHQVFPPSEENVLENTMPRTARKLPKSSYWIPPGESALKTLLLSTNQNQVVPHSGENVLENTMPITARKLPKSSYWIPPGESALKTLLLSTNQHQVFPPSEENVLENTMPITARKLPKSSYWIPPGESALKTLLLSTNQNQVVPPSGENVLENTMPITARKFPKSSYWIPPGESALKTLLLSTNQNQVVPPSGENVLENTMPITTRKFPKSSYWIPPGESVLKTLLLSTNQHQVVPPSGKNIKTKKTARKSIYSKRTGLSDKNEHGGAGNSLAVKETVKETKQHDLPTSYSSIGNLPSTSKGEFSDQKCNVNTPKDENTTKLQLTKSKKTTGSETIKPTDGSVLKTLLLSKK